MIYYLLKYNQSNYNSMSIEQHPLFSAYHTRNTAEETIRVNGISILRKSSIANHYALTIIHTNNKVIHYLIQQRPTSFAVVSESGRIYREFPNVNELIQQIAYQPNINEDPQ